MKHTIKNILAPALAMILTLAFVAGCNGTDGAPGMDEPRRDIQASSGGQDDTGPQTSGAPQTAPGVRTIMNRNIPVAQIAADAARLDWPAAEFPAGFPAYPEGEVVMAERDEDGFYVYIAGTGRRGYDSYIAALGAAGWDFTDTEADDWDVAFKDDLLLILVCDSDGVGMLIDVLNYDDIYPDYGWPSSILPDGFPAYPGGRVWFIREWDDGDNVMISINDTDRRTFDAYIATLESMGWSFDENGDAYKGYFWLSVTWEEPDSVDISLMGGDFDWDSLGGFGDPSGQEWPRDLPFNVPEYTDGIIAGTVTGGAGTSIRIVNSSRAAFEAYIDMLIGLGFRPNDPQDVYPDMGILWYDEDAFQHILLSIDSDGTTVSFLIVG